MMFYLGTGGSWQQKKQRRWELWWTQEPGPEYGGGKRRNSRSWREWREQWRLQTGGRALAGRPACGDAGQQAAAPGGEGLM